MPAFPSSQPYGYISRPDCGVGCTELTYTPNSLLDTTTTTISAYYDDFGGSKDDRTILVDLDYDTHKRVAQMTLTTNEPVAEGVLASLERGTGIDYDVDTDLDSFTVKDEELDDVTYHVNELGQLTAVDVGVTNFVTYTLRADGLPETAAYANGATTEWDYWDDQRVKSIEHLDAGDATLLKLEYFWTPDGLVDHIDNTTNDGAYTVSYEYDLRSRLVHEYTTDAPEDVSYDTYYDYDQNGNRTMMVEDRPSPAHDVVTTYKYDISNPGVYETNHNRLLYSLRFEDDDADHERDGGEEVLEERWWTYDRAGRVRRVMERWPAEDAETFQTTRLDYTGAGQLWLARRFSCTQVAWTLLHIRLRSRGCTCIAGNGR